MDPLELIEDQHEELERQLEDLLEERGRPASPRLEERWQAFRRKLQLYLVGEGRALDVLPEDPEGFDPAIVQATRERHTHLAALLSGCTRHAPGHERWWSSLSHLGRSLLFHFQEEQDELLPQLAGSLAPGSARRMAKEIRQQLDRAG